MNDRELKIRYQVEANTAQAEALLRQNQALMAGVAQAGGKAAQSHAGQSKAAGALAEQMKALNRELGRVPELSAMLHLIKHPVTLAAVALGLAIVKLREMWAAVEQFSASERAVREFQYSMESLRTTTQALAHEDELFLEQLWKIEAATQSLAAQQERYNEQLNRTARLKTEAVDLELAAATEQVEADRSLTPAQKTQRKFDLKRQAEAKKIKIERERQQGEFLGYEYTAREAEQLGAGLEGQLDGLAAKQAGLDGDLDTATTRAKKSKDIALQKGEELAELDRLEEVWAKNDPSMFSGDFWSGFGLQLKHFPLGAAEAIAEERKKKGTMATPLLNQADLDARAANQAKKAVDQAAADRETIRQKIQEAEQTRVKALQDLANKTKQYAEENAAADRKFAVEGNTQRLQAARAVQEEERKWYLERARLKLRHHESTMGPIPTASQRATHLRLQEAVLGLEHAGPENADIRSAEKAMLQNRMREEFFKTVDELYPQLGPRGTFRMMGPAPAAAPAPALPGIQQLDKAGQDAGKQLSQSMGSAAASLERLASRMPAAADRLAAAADHLAWVTHTS